jgi:hypothetical protein
MPGIEKLRKESLAALSAVGKRRDGALVTLNVNRMTLRELVESTLPVAPRQFHSFAIPHENPAWLRQAFKATLMSRVSIEEVSPKSELLA